MATTKDTNEPNKFFSLVPQKSKPNLLAQVTKLCISVLCACNHRATVLVYVNVANLTLHGLIQRDNRGITFLLRGFGHLLFQSRFGLCLVYIHLSIPDTFTTRGYFRVIER